MSSCIRLLQCAGFRFDSPSWDGPEKWTAQRNQDLWQTFDEVLWICQMEKIQLLFLTGDLFEQEYVRKETVERVAQSFARLEGTKIFITPGKRDPLTLTSAYRLAAWPSNVHIFSSGVSSVKIPSINVTVSGAGWTSYQQDKPFIKDFIAANDGTIQLMLLHAEVDSEICAEGFIPIQQSEIASSGLTYLALGHREVWSGIQQEGETFWADCGEPEARGFHYSGQHGVIVGEIENKSCRFEFRELGRRYYTEKELTIHSTNDIDVIVAKLLEETSLEERHRDMFRINLSGTLLNHEDWIVSTLQNLLETEFRFVEVLSLGREQPPSRSREVSVDSNSGDYSSVAQIFVDKLQKRLKDEKGSETYQYWELVQKIALTALEQGRISYED